MTEREQEILKAIDTFVNDDNWLFNMHDNLARGGYNVEEKQEITDKIHDLYIFGTEDGYENGIWHGFCLTEDVVKAIADDEEDRALTMIETALHVDREEASDMLKGIKEALN